MRSSALAGFLASAVLISGTAGFASTFVVGPYLGDQVLHQSPRAAMMSSTAPIDPLAVLQISVANAAPLEGEAPASQPAHRLRGIENAATTQTATLPSARPAVATTSEMPGPITEEAFASTTKPAARPVSAGGPLIAAEASSAMVSAKLENGEPVLTLRIAPIVTPTLPTADLANPDDAVEPTVMSAPPSEQALATPAIAAAPEPAEVEDEPVAPPPAEPQTKPRLKPAAMKPAPAAAEPARKPKPRTPARVSTTAPAAPPAAAIEEQLPAAPPPAPDPLNAPYTPLTSPTLGNEEPATSAPAPMTPSPQSTGGPTPLTVPQ